MNVQKILKELRERYPGKEIIFDPPQNPAEIIVEIESARDYPERSVALAVVGKSRMHYHVRSTEIYEVVRGVLVLYLDDVKYVLREGEKMEVLPGVRHYAEGEETWFLTYSTPGWTAEDHILL